MTRYLPLPPEAADTIAGLREAGNTPVVEVDIGTGLNLPHDPTGVALTRCRFVAETPWPNAAT